MVESSYGVGKLEGKEEAKAEIAINLLDILDDAAISKKTGLPLNDVQALRKKHTTPSLHLEDV